MSAEGRPVYEFASFRLDVAEQILLRDGVPVPLTPKNFQLLRLLVANSGHLVDKDRLLKEIWPDSFVEEGNLARSISVLRKALGESAANQEYIETLPKRGYRFVAPVIEYPTPAQRPQPSPPLPPAAPSPSIRAAHSRGAVVAIGAVAVLAVLSYVAVGRDDDASRDPSAAPLAPAPSHTQVTFRGNEGSPALSRDGKLSYVSTTASDRTLTLQQLGGGQPLAVFSAPEVGRLRWSPDGSRLLFWTRGTGRNGLYVMPQLGGVPRVIAPRAYVGCWSPDGSTIAVATYLPAGISFVDATGGVQRSVALDGSDSWIWDIDWSPVHNQLVMVSNDDDGRYAIWTMRPDGSGQKRLVSGSSWIPAVRWAPRGDAIYYFRRSGRTVSLFKISFTAIEPTTDAPVPLITGLESDGSFALSADATRLVYARGPYHSNLWLAERNGLRTGTGVKTTELTRGTAVDERPRFSPDGESIVFSREEGALTNLYTMRRGGAAPTQLTFLNAPTVGAAWSPDGRQLAFGSTVDGAPRVWIASADGSAPRAVSSGHMSDSFDISWSSDSQIYYQQSGNRNYYVLDPKDGRERLLVNDTSVGWIFSPVLSPDRTQLAVAWNRPPHRGIWLLDTRSGGETMVSGSAPMPHPIRWSTDGRWIYALASEPGRYRGGLLRLGETSTRARIVRVSAAGGEPETLLELPFEEIGGVDVSADGRRVVCAVYTSRSDLWMVENFDPSTRAR